MKTKNAKNPTPKGKVKVLYQYLNGRWYAFADLENEIFVGRVDDKKSGAEKPSNLEEKTSVAEGSKKKGRAGAKAA